MNVEVQVLLHGDFPEMHSNLFNCLSRFLPREIPIRFHLNDIQGKSLRLVEKFVGRRSLLSEVEVEASENIGKFPAMRKMFKASKADWICWFDDDSYLYVEDWWPQTINFIERFPDLGALGSELLGSWTDKQWAWIKTRPWFCGKPRRIQCYSIFGPYMWIHRSVIRQLDWPDPELKHNNTDSPEGIDGDLLLGEAMYQNNLPLSFFWYGVKVQSEKRRGIGGDA